MKILELGPTFKQVCDSAAFLQCLRRDGWARHPQARLLPLSGGVSSDIYLVEDGGERYVVKRALPKLRVKEEWLADTRRNVSERDFIECVSGFLPDAVPRLLFSSAESGYFVMEYLGEGFSNWKRLLLAGCSVSAHARRAAQILGEIHRRTAGDPEIERRFDTVRNFRQLRIEPYLLTTGERNPALRDLFSQEARRLASAREGLVHGDFSPKNFLICGERMVVLDCEVAWYGDPSFDVAFLLNHLFLKSLYHAPRSVGIEQMIPAFWKSYLDCLQTKPQNDLEERAARLLLMLMLARVDGKSPVEYLGAAQTRFVREFVRRHLTAGGFDFAALTSAWFEQIMTLPRIAQRV